MGSGLRPPKIRELDVAADAKVVSKSRALAFRAYPDHYASDTLFSLLIGVLRYRPYTWCYSALWNRFVLYQWN